MRKLLILLCILAFSTPIYAAGFLGFGEDKQPVKQENNTFFNVAKDTACGTNKEIKRPEQSEINLDFDGMLYLHPRQPADPQFRQDSFSIGVTYKFSSHVHMFAKNVTLSIDGTDENGGNTEWKHEHYLAGFGISWYHKDNQVQFNVGSSIGSKVTENVSGLDLKVKDALLTELKYMVIFDNIGVGGILSIMNAKWDSGDDSNKNMNPGYQYIGITVQIGLPGLDIKSY